MKSKLRKKEVFFENTTLKPNYIDIAKIKAVQSKSYLNCADYPEFEPCSHPGPCRKDNCKCIKSM
jgi:hypothetical protein